MHQRCFSTDIPRNSSVYSTSYYQTDDGDGEDPFICAMGDGGESTGLAACVDSQVKRALLNLAIHGVGSGC